MSGTMTFWICNSLVLDGDKVLPIPGSYVGWPEKALEAINKCEIACIEFWRSHYSGDVIGAIWATLEGELHTWIDEYCVFDAFATSSMITKNALYICKGPKQVHKHVMTGDYQQVFDDYGITYDGRIIDFCPSKEGRIQEHERQFERLESVLWIGDGFCVSTGANTQDHTGTPCTIISEGPDVLAHLPIESTHAYVINDESIAIVDSDNQFRYYECDYTGHWSETYSSQLTSSAHTLRWSAMLCTDGSVWTYDTYGLQQAELDGEPFMVQPPAGHRKPAI